METPLIEFKGITKRFSGKTVLDRIDLSIYENQITTIIGKSGSGKSVLIKHIIGLLSPDEGSILFRGKPVDKMKKKEWEEYRSRISYMFQNNALFDSMTVFENIALPLKQTTNLKKKEIEKKVMSRIEQMELLDAANKYPAELSGGMQKRVAMARALVTDPAIVLFDEPTTSQDPIRRNIILSMIAHYRKKFGFTAILISHDIPDVFFISDRILLLWDGKIAFNGSYEEFYRLKHPMIDEFLLSIEGLKDELTGLLSKRMFRSRYDILTDQRNIGNIITAVLFSIEFKMPDEINGSLISTEILKALGEYVNTYFGPLGGFSARHSSRKILTVLPYLKPEEVEKSVHDFALELQQKTLTGSAADVRECFEIEVTAGITEAGPSDDIENIIEKAEKNKKIIALYKCGKEDS